MNSLYSHKPESWLPWFIRGILVIVFLVLFSKLFEVQIIKGNYFRDLSERNRIRHIPLPAPRGKIVARGGEILAGNVEIKRRVKFTTGGSFEITEDLTGANPEEIITDYKRFYILGADFAHASGYLGQIGEDELNKVNPGCPEKGIRDSVTFVGKTGLEAKYECLLKGIPGEELIEVDNFGKKVRTLAKRDSIAGQDLKTSINYSLQIETAKDMEGKPGAAIITDVNGEILSFYSSPSFDPNLLIEGKDNQKIADLFKDKNLPLFDRVISGTFHPGSVFKPLVALAALEEKIITKNFVYNDPGVITVSGFSYTNWFFTENGRLEGQIGLVRAMARSTDTFFYKIGEMVGPDAIAKWADKFGLDKKTGIDIGGETYGLIPTPAWKKEFKKESWFLGNTYHMAIGQGDVAVTPIEINRYITAIASGGKLCKPHFYGGIDTSKCENLNINKDDLSLVIAGMKAVCTTGGTGYTFFDFSSKHNGADVACKTGTAEVGTDGTPHAWFTLFAPIEKPEVVATILIERGGQGSSVAGPIARKIMDFYFQKGQ